MATGRQGLEDYIVRVVADFRWIHDEPLQSLPTISLGGPGVNALAHRWLEEVPVSLAYSERYFIQMDPDLTEIRASIWGMDNATTQIAVSVFLDRFLPRFLERCATSTAHLSTLDGDGETGTVTTMTTTIDQVSEIAIDRVLLLNRRLFGDGSCRGTLRSTGSQPPAWH